MTNDISEQMNAGEVPGVQFKERILGKHDIVCELVAFSNSHGGKLVTGIKDKTGGTNTLSYSEVQETTNLLSGITSEDVVPSILTEIDTVGVEGGSLVIITVKEGLNKPYHDSKGTVWVKNGVDKREVFDDAELAEMMADCDNFASDEADARNATVNDLDAMTIERYLDNRFERILEKKGLIGDAFSEASFDMICSVITKGHDCEKILRNLQFICPDGSLTAAAMLPLGEYTQCWLSMITAKCICFTGNSVGSRALRDRVNDADMEGNLLHRYDMTMDFFTRDLRNVQVGDEFNSTGKLEIPYTNPVEFTVDNFVYRSLNMKAPVRIFIFDDRVKIHSPGALPSELTINDIKAGIFMPHNVLFLNSTIYLLPYTDVSSGITCVLDEDINVTFMSNDKAQEFVITAWRGESNQIKKKSNRVEERGNQVEQKSDEVEGKSNQVQDPDVKKVSLSNKQRGIVDFCSVLRTTAETTERLGLSNRTKSRERYITSLVAAGYLQITNPDNPTASSQKYKKVNRR